MQTKELTTKVMVNNEEMTFKIGRLAPRAESAVWAQLGDTVVLTVVSWNNKDSELDYFPLSVEYIEKFYAGGIISGSRFLKREMRPSEEAVLKARQIDHSIRSLFPKSFKKEVSVIVTVLSYDEEHDPGLLAVNSASMALMLSSIPFSGPSASVKIGLQGSDILVNPKDSLDENTLDAEFIISVRDERILNIEGWGDEIPEELMDKILDTAVESCQPLLKAQKEFVKQAGKEKMPFKEDAVDKDLLKSIEKDHFKEIEKALYDEQRNEAMQKIKDSLFEKNPEISKANYDAAVEHVAREIMRQGVLDNEKRVSGRKIDEIRDLEIEIGVLPRVHGSSLFRRGLTQSLSIVTLGSTRLKQTLESFEGESEKPFMHHYNAPNYSIGEAGRFSYYPGRREIGHGHITENAMKKILPATDKFPYTIRVVSEILSQQGSSSMAAASATSLALMNAGVPVKAQIAGISIGLVTDDDDLNKYKLLVDIADVEDYYGDMDFKVTGSEKGVTAIQLDNKLQGVPVEILKNAFKKSRQARLTILEEMNKIIAKPNESISEYAPKVISFKISPSKIGDVIGPGGKMIKSIIEKAGEDVDIDIQDDGQVNISSISKERIDIAARMVRDLVLEPEIGQVYTGTVAKLAEYGAFIDITPNLTGLLHISEASDRYVKDIRTILKLGQEVKVKIKKIENGKVGLTLKGV